MQKKIIALAVAALFGAACQTSGGVVQITSRTPAQVAASVCPSVQAVVGVLSVPGALDPAAEAELLAAVPLIDAVCSVGDLVQLVDLQALHKNAVPVLLKAVQASPLDADKKQAVTLGIAVAQAAIAPLVQ